ncbi:hypothetical protein [Methanolobus sp.]|uniref:hypothetical protein n=1 Tax=Methanolobus sp. TaxID=1874737 RepID=UPI0025D5C448|nr:hypothetical protein [Methanolobus sp.]
MEHKIKNKVSLIFFLFFIVVLIILFHIYINPDAQSPEFMFFLALMTGFLLIHAIMVKGLKKDLETEKQKKD